MRSIWRVLAAKLPAASGGGEVIAMASDGHERVTNTELAPHALGLDVLWIPRTGVLQPRVDVGDRIPLVLNGPEYFSVPAFYRVVFGVLTF